MSITAVTVFLVAYGLTKTSSAAVRRTTTAAGQEKFLGSTTWAAFVADVRTTEAGREVFSRYYQNSQGSRRTEAYSPDKSERVVTIHNLERRMSYSQGPRGDWAMLPLSPKFRDRPPQMPIDTAGLSPMPEKRLGISVYPYISGAEVRSLLAPDLNLFSVFSDDGRRQEEVVALTIGETDATMFYPPETAKIRLASSIADLLRPVPTGDK